MKEKESVHEKSSSGNGFEESRIINKIMAIIGIVFGIIFSPILGFIFGVIPLYLNRDKKIWTSIIQIIVVSVLALAGMTMLMLPSNYRTTSVIFIAIIFLVISAVMIIMTYIKTSKNKDIARLSLIAIVVSVVMAVLSSVLSKYLSGIQLTSA